MVEQMDEEGFGDCSNHGECEAACPKSIAIENISVLRRERLRATVAKHWTASARERSSAWRR